MKSLFVGFALALVMTTAGVDTQAQSLVEEVDGGQIDWQQSYIEATGQGTARYTGNRIQEELLAKQAARTTALSRLLEMTQGVRITGLTTLGAQAQADTRAASRIKGTIKGAKLVSETVTWHKDESSRRGEVPFAEVTLRLCMDAGCSESKTNISQITVSDSTPIEKPISAPKTDALSAVIIDLEKALFLPALSPEIINEQGDIIYASSLVDDAIKREKGLVHYVKDVTTAKRMDIAGTKPMVISALKISADNQIVLSDEDSAKLVESASLKAAKVIVALD